VTARKVAVVSEGNDYSSYLKINDLLNLQERQTPGADDELLFIIIHQSYELWFKLVIDELRQAIAALEANEPWLAVAPLQRIRTVEDLLLSHLDVLETMSPEGFLAFRDPLHPASGFQSVQFRAIEFLSGGGQVEMLTFELFDDAQRRWLRDISQETTLWAGFCRALGASESDHHEVQRSLESLYHDHRSAPKTTLHTLAELLIDHDERVALWRYRHLLMAARQIGRRPGTGGSSGMPYLDSTLSRRFYPALWEVRSTL